MCDAPSDVKSCVLRSSLRRVLRHRPTAEAPLLIRVGTGTRPGQVTFTRIWVNVVLTFVILLTFVTFAERVTALCHNSRLLLACRFDFFTR